MAGSLGATPHVHFEVEKIIGISNDGSYQVQWAPAWVSRFHLVGCEHLIQEFLQQQAEKERYEPVTQYEIQNTQIGSSGSSLQLTEINSVSSYSCTEFPNQTEKTGFQTDTAYKEEFVDDSQQLSLTSEESEKMPSVMFSTTTTDFKDGGNQDEDFVESGNNVGAVADGSPVCVKVEEELNTNEISEHDLLNLSDVSANTLSEDIAIRMPVDLRGRDNADSSADPDGFTKSSFEASKNSKRKYICTYCNKGFTRNLYLNQHVRIHTGERYWACDMCGFLFARKQHLKTHKKRYKDNCKKVFKKKLGKTTQTSNDGYSLVQDEGIMESESHVSVVPEVGNVCVQVEEELDTSEISEDNLLTLSHIVTNTLSEDIDIQMPVDLLCRDKADSSAYPDGGTKSSFEGSESSKRKYICTYCNKEFTRNLYLNQHVRIHTGERYWACDMCGFSFAQKSHLKRHKERHKGKDCKKIFKKLLENNSNID